MAELQDLVPGGQTDVWGDILEQNLVALNNELMATTAKADAAPTGDEVLAAAADAEARAIAASEPRVPRAGALQGYIVTLGSDGGLTFTPAAEAGTPLPAASESQKGILLLTNDLGGTSDLPTTPTAVHKTGNEDIYGTKTFHAPPVLPAASLPVTVLNADGTANGYLRRDGTWSDPPGTSGGTAGANALGTWNNPVTDPNAARPSGLTRVVWATYPTNPPARQAGDYLIHPGVVVSGA